MEKKKLNVLMGVLAACIVVVATVLGVRLIGQSSDSGTEGNGGSGKDTAVSGDSTYIEPVTEIEIPDDGMYSIEVKTEGDMFFEGIGVYIYTDNTMEELVWFDKTDENGIAEFTAEDATGYVAVLQDIPEGYNIQEYYYITGAKTEIILGTALKEGVDLSEIEYSLGDVVHDFTVTAPDGTTYTVSEILEKKKAIILNFWYVQCGPCKEEFPHMNEAYAQYKDKIEILAMNPVNLDDEEIAKYIKDMGIKFPMMQCEEEWATAMGITAYPTTVVIDRYGVISLMHRGSLPDTEIFKQLFEFYAADDYKQTVVEDIYDIVSAELSQGTMDNPFELGGILDFEITIRPEQVIYFNMYRVDQMNVRIEDVDAYATYGEKTYYPENGVVGFKVSCPDTYTPAFVGIGNAGAEKKTFHVTLVADAGTYENPYQLKLGEFTASVRAQNDQGVFYEYRAAKTGALTVECLSATKGVKYDYYLQNMRTSENRNLEYDGATSTDGNPTVSINVEKGDRVLVCISTLPDSSGSYPAGTFKMKASLGNSLAIDEQYYSVSVVDDNLTPIGNVSVKLTCLEIEPIEGVDDSKEDATKVGDEISLTTDAKGVASRKLRIGKYKVVAAKPNGYTPDTTEYVVTKDAPNITFVMEKDIVVTKNYTVTVLDEEENPIRGAQVLIEGTSKTTNDNGEAVFENLPVKSYKVTVSNGAEYETASAQFADGEIALTVKLKKVDSDTTEKIKYKVIIDYSGTLSEDITVLVSNSENSATATVDRKTKTATVSLPKGNYDVELFFANGSVLASYSTDVTLTETKTTAKVKVDKAIGNGGIGVTEGISPGGVEKTAYIVSTGATPVIGMDMNNINYFIFEPEESGVYKFTTNNASARISFWNSPFFCQDSTAVLGDDYDELTNSFIYQTYGSSIVIGITGAEKATLIITRISDVQVEVQPTVYEAVVPPTNFKYSGKALNYFEPTETDASKYALVKGLDGYYRLASTNEIVYVDLDYDLLSMTDLVSKTGLKCWFYNEDGTLKEKVDYTDCLTKYVDCRDSKTGYYPLTDDLMTIIKNGGKHAGWWDSKSPNYRFEGKVVNTEIAWLFFCCAAGL